MDKKTILLLKTVWYYFETKAVILQGEGDSDVLAFLCQMRCHTPKVQISRSIFDSNSVKPFLGTPSGTSDDFKTFFHFIYKNHESIQKSKFKVWSYQEAARK